MIINYKDIRKDKISYLKDLYFRKEEIIKDIVNLDIDKKYIFRGMNDLNQLNPSIVRKGLVEKELQIIDEFERLSEEFGNNSNYFLDILALAQHYNVPTRLIDWTYNPFVALFFALYSKSEDDRYYIFYVDKTEQIVFTEPMQRYVGGWRIKTGSSAKDFDNFIQLINSDDDLLKKIDNSNTIYQCLDSYIEINQNVRNDALIIFDCYKNNPRILAQSGLFSIPKDINEEHSIYEEIVRNCNKSTIKINDIERKELLLTLERLGYSELTLFPELTSISKYICDKWNNH